MSAEIAIRAGARLINTTMRQKTLASMLRPAIEACPCVECAVELAGGMQQSRSGGEDGIAEQIQAHAKRDRAETREKISDLRQFRIGRKTVP